MCISKDVVEQFNKNVDKVSTSFVVSEVWNEKESCTDSVVVPLVRYQESYKDDVSKWVLGDEYYFFSYYTFTNNPDVIELDGDYVDTSTGEILGKVVREKPKRKTTLVTPFRDFSCYDDLREWALQNGYKATATLHSNVSAWEDVIDTLPLLMLIRDVDYVNVGFYERKHLCDVFGCDDKSLNRKLKQYEKVGVFKCATKGLFKKGTVRIVFHPVVAFRGNERLQEVMVRNWYKPKSSDQLVPSKEWFEKVDAIPQSEVEEYLNRADMEMATAIFESHLAENEVLGNEGKSINKCVIKYFGDECDNKTRILTCTDVDFKLFVNGKLPVESLKRV
jgi:hypothetical protein